MTEPWERLHSVATEALPWLWYDFAKDGRESAVLAPLAKYPKAAGWLARSMATSGVDTTRKLAAMLAGWIDDPEQTDLLTKMLDNERTVFVENPYAANSVAEDIMFAATRWSEKPPGRTHETGIVVLAEMINDALTVIPWNTVHWAAANLYAATGGKHEMLSRLQATADEEFVGKDSPFLKKTAAALRSGDKDTLTRLITSPPPFSELSIDDRCFASACDLWEAAAAAEESR